MLINTYWSIGLLLCWQFDTVVATVRYSFISLSRTNSNLTSVLQTGIEITMVFILRYIQLMDFSLLYFLTLSDSYYYQQKVWKSNFCDNFSNVKRVRHYCLLINIEHCSCSICCFSLLEQVQWNVRLGLLLVQKRWRDSFRAVFDLCVCWQY